MNSPLRIIATGGTFDKAYDPIAGRLTFSDSHLGDVLARARLNVSCALTTLPLLDSLDMDDADRERILESCASASESHIVIIHGTDTMPETARLLGRSSETRLAGKTIVLTGAMIPYSVANSDALFNLGYALACAQLGKSGVYVAMNGELFGCNTVYKDKIVGQFRTKA
jgi:L-asparaginase